MRLERLADGALESDVATRYARLVVSGRPVRPKETTMAKVGFAAVVFFALGVAVGRWSATLEGPRSSASPVVAAPTVAPPVAAGSPGAAPLRGRVEEVLQVPNYSYLRLEGGAWAVVEADPSLAVGQMVTVLPQTEVVDFTSPSLGRTFARVWFGTLEGAKPGARAAQPPAPVALPALGEASPAPATAGAITQVTVAALHAERRALAGRRVRVSGTVDRVNLVQGVGYVHLRDGSGSAASGDDDLLAITSAAAPQKGVTGTFEGVVAVDRDVGMGAKPVVLDEVRQVGP